MAQGSLTGGWTKQGSSQAVIRQTQGTAGANASMGYAGKILPCQCFQIECEEPRHPDYDTQSAACQVTAYLKHKSFSFLYPSPSLHLPLQLLGWALSSGAQAQHRGSRFLLASVPLQPSILDSHSPRYRRHHLGSKEQAQSPQETQDKRNHGA